jgi:ferric-dicitrate binding protein FerR (iron transport regulator)
VVTKKRRRRQLARASAQRRAQRAASRASRRRLLQLIVAAVLVVGAVTALAVWIAVHDGGSGSQTAAGYHSLPVAAAAAPSLEVKT